MLRRLTSSHAAAQPPRFFDNTNCTNFGFARSASGQMRVPAKQPPRDQTDISRGSHLSADYADEKDSLFGRLIDRSRMSDLNPAVEEVTYMHSPLLKDSGPIEASRSINCSASASRLSAVERQRPH